jgi:hypothetical protein
MRGCGVYCIYSDTPRGWKVLKERLNYTIMNISEKLHTNDNS